MHVATPDPAPDAGSGNAPPAPVAPPVAPEPAVAAEHPFEFSGETAEYFRIWVVNLALTLLTLGVFSAWAKVRTQRYFYGNTRVAGVPFEYQARPVPILIGRLIAFTLFVAYLFAGRLLVGAELVVFALIGLMTPWLVVRSLMFRARYSAWNSINFRFAGRLREAFRVYLFWYLLIPFTLGLIYPYIRARQKRFVAMNHRFGTSEFAFRASAGDFYPIYLAAGGLVILATFSSGMMAAIVVPNSGGRNIESVMFIMAAVVYGAYFLAFVFVAARVTNLVYDNTSVAGLRFVSTVRARDLAGLYLSNTFAIVLSLGMAVPWAMIRMARYRAARLTMLSVGGVEGFVAETRREESAIGAEVGHTFDVDIGL